MNRNQLLLLYVFLLLVLLVLWLEIYALPLVILWLIARWRKDSRPDRISMIVGFAAAYAIVYLFVGSVSEKVEWTIILIIVAALTPALNRFNFKRNE
jgi:4-amino-4-deoxy-L-arabinose transferase-like glycosyltransferase